jgi:hypothetical protein
MRGGAPGHETVWTSTTTQMPLSIRRARRTTSASWSGTCVTLVSQVLPGLTAGAGGTSAPRVREPWNSRLLFGPVQRG